MEKLLKEDSENIARTMTITEKRYHEWIDRFISGHNTWFSADLESVGYDQEKRVALIKWNGKVRKRVPGFLKRRSLYYERQLRWFGDRMTHNRFYIWYEKVDLRGFLYHLNKHKLFSTWAYYLHDFQMYGNIHVSTMFYKIWKAGHNPTKARQIVFRWLKLNINAVKEEVKTYHEKKWRKGTWKKEEYRTERLNRLYKELNDGNDI